VLAEWRDENGVLEQLQVVSDGLVGSFLLELALNLLKGHDLCRGRRQRPNTWRRSAGFLMAARARTSRSMAASGPFAAALDGCFLVPFRKLEEERGLSHLPRAGEKLDPTRAPAPPRRRGTFRA
jgi:hypothetical protein